VGVLDHQPELIFTQDMPTEILGSATASCRDVSSSPPQQLSTTQAVPIVATTLEEQPDEEVIVENADDNDVEAAAAATTTATAATTEDDENADDDSQNSARKRTRAQEGISGEQSAELNLMQRTQKKQRNGYKTIIETAEYKQEKSELMTMIPDDVIGYVLGFCKTVQDRFMMQITCKAIRRISNNSDEILSYIKLGGNVTGRGGIISEDDTPTTTSKKLKPYAKAGNLEAIYMLGMIKSYCNYYDVDKGINLLRLAAKLGSVRAGYTLGVILRDLRPREARRYMKDTAELGYFPALQEILSARELKNRFGEPSAGDLSHYLDPVCLNRLLGRHYIVCPHLRDLNTSHCWNPLCGRWAFRALNYQSSPVVNVANADLSNSDSVSSIRRSSNSENNRILGTSNNNDNGVENIGRAGCLVAVGRTRLSRMKMCSRCCRAKYCSKLCQVYDWRSGRHKVECPFL